MSETPDNINYGQQGVNTELVRDDVDYGQRRVNAALVQVDRIIIEALKTLIDILKSTNAVSLDQQAAFKLAQIDLNSLEAAISSVSSAGKKVADITPAGTSHPNSDSFLRVARSLKLEGPPDWSSRIDDYLYGDNQRSDE